MYADHEGLGATIAYDRDAAIRAFQAQQSGIQRTFNAPGTYTMPVLYLPQTTPVVKPSPALPAPTTIRPPSPTTVKPITATLPVLKPTISTKPTTPKPTTVTVSGGGSGSPTLLSAGVGGSALADMMKTPLPLMIGGLLLLFVAMGDKKKGR